jgi:hypothetical protein
MADRFHGGRGREMAPQRPDPAIRERIRAAVVKTAELNA